MSRPPLPPIDFRALAEALLARGRELCEAWLPGGTVRGHEYVCGSLAGGEGSSCSVNLNDGKWADFAGSDEDKGGDLLSLYAAIHRIDQGQAALRVAREEGLESVANIVAGAERGDSPPPPPRPPAPPPKPKPEAEGWTSVMPVPPSAPGPTFRHAYRQPGDIMHTATYAVGEHVMGYVVRFRTSDGGKETLPYTWCVSARDGAARWHWRQWDLYRPLFYPGRAHPEGRTVVLVEGEIKAEVLQALLEAHAPGIYCVASWPGGGKAWKKAAWKWIRGSTVLLWPDCDSKRVPLTRGEAAQCLDDAALETAKAMKPLLPAVKQPGMSAMLGVGAHLRDAQACTVSILPIPEPGEVVDGWDARDAIEVDGWDGARVLTFFGRAQPLPADAEGDLPAGGSGGAAGGGGGHGGPARDRPAEADEGDDAFAEYLAFVCKQAKCQPYELGINRKMIITALRKAPDLVGCLGFDELRGAPCTRKPWPWRVKAGPLKDADALRLGDWLTQEYGLKAASLSALSEAIDTVADENHFHPVREQLQAMQHDGKKRLDKWLIHVLGLDPEALTPRYRRYLELVGRYLLLGMVARVMDPGCKFDYSPVFEGLPGMGKSTFARELVGAEFFSDTHFDIGNGKEGMEQLEGLWGYELSEMTAFRRADSESVKQFFSSTVDRFRGAYGKYVQPHPRQCVIFCTTNKRAYLYDLTGNRRFWPIWIFQLINLEWLRKWRSQLFAEAYAAYTAGERYYPTPEDEEAYFVPEQRKRLVETAVQSRLYELLTREGAANGEGKLSQQITQLTKFVTLTDLVAALGADAAKSTSLLENQIRGWLEANGWIYKREGGGQRRYGFVQPAVWPPEIDDDEEPVVRPPAPPTPKSEGPRAEADPYGGSDDDPF